MKAFVNLDLASGFFDAIFSVLHFKINKQLWI
jgi:hypothetical protein